MRRVNKVLCAMSGGVDSSVAATLLKQQNFDVVGIFFETQKYTKKRLNQHKNNAKRVCDKLDIPFYIFDVSKKFKQEVIDYFILEYEAGRTPNPCVVCNKKIKFKHLVNIAKKLKCDKIATGHYARIKRKRQNAKCKTTTKNSKLYQLLKCKDKKKDQSYFLWQLTRRQLSKIIFPLGDYTKSEVKKLAKRFKLPINTKEESQDVCFIPSVDRTEFMRTHAEKLTKSGNVVDKAGNVLGRHKGLCYYTIGQRKNLGGNLKFKISNLKFDKRRPKKVFVVELDISKNQLIAGEEKDLYSKIVEADKLNWIRTGQPKAGLIINAKIRYAHKSARCKIIKVNKGQIKVKFNKPQRAISPGQSIVFYQKDKLLGGAIIK